MPPVAGQREYLHPFRIFTGPDQPAHAHRGGRHQFLVQVYSLGYMAGDPGFSRYYAFQSLFAGP